MNWDIVYLKEAKSDLEKLDNSIRIQVLKGIQKVSNNPLPVNNRGYGKPLGSKSSTNLTNLFKIKFKNIGIRVVYKIEYVETTMKIIVISARSDEEVYKEALARRKKHNL
jgi:plasmid stabilization system